MSEMLSNKQSDEYVPEIIDRDIPAEQTELGEEIADRANLERELEERSAAEFLLQFQDLKADVRQEATKAISTIEASVAKGKNLLSTPKDIILGWRVEKAKQKYDRRSKKLDTSRFDFINRHHEKKAQAASAELYFVTQTHTEHTGMMQDRLDRADTRSKERQEVINARRKELHEARLAAIERRIIRHESIKQRRKLEHDYSQYAYEEREAAIKQYVEQPAFKKRIRSQAEKVVQGQERGKAQAYINNNEKDADNKIEQDINEEGA